MEAVRAAREEAGLSQRALAKKAHVAFRTVQLLERGGHDARDSTFARIAAALGRPAGELRGEASLSGPSLARAAALIRRDGTPSWTVHLFDFVDAFRRAPAFALVSEAPGVDDEPRLLALYAAVVETLASERGVRTPWWCAGIRPLPEPWFVAGVENLKASALVESPAAFRRRNVFVLGNFLERA